MSDYLDMQRGFRPEGCTCVMHSDVNYGPYDPHPAEWEEAEDCPRHRAAVGVEKDTERGLGKETNG